MASPSATGDIDEPSDPQVPPSLVEEKRGEPVQPESDDAHLSNDDDDDVSPTTTADGDGGWVSIQESDTPPVSSKIQVIVLASFKSMDRQVTRQQFDALSILDSNSVSYQVLDGSNPGLSLKRSKLWLISGAKLGVYPQFFVVQPGPLNQNRSSKDDDDNNDTTNDEKDNSSGRWAQTTFWGDYTRLAQLNETPGAVAKEFGGTPPSHPPTPVTSPSAKSNPEGESQPEQDDETETNDDDSNSVSWHNLVVLGLLTCLVLAIPIFLSGKEKDRGRPNLVVTIEETADQMWQTLSNTFFAEKDEGENVLNVSRENDWSNPLDDKEFLSNVFGTTTNSMSRRQQQLQKEQASATTTSTDTPASATTKPAWKDPFDWFEGSAQDENLQAFFRDVANFFHTKDKQSKKKQQQHHKKSGGGGGEEGGDNGEDEEYNFLMNDEEDQLMAQMMTEFLGQKTGAAARKSLGQIINLLTNSTAEVFRQVNQTLGHVGLERFNLLQFNYFMEDQEGKKNSVWKRKQHRYQPELPLEAALQLHDGLYLSQLAYAPSCDEIHKRIQNFKQGLWMLRNCTTESSVLEPAHFVLVRKLNAANTLKDQLRQTWTDLVGSTATTFRKRAAADWSWLAGPLQHVPPKRQQIEVAIVVRGSKEVFDFLTDGMLLASKYQDGKAHDGILKAAQWLEQHYRDDFKRFYRNSKKVFGNRKPMKLWLLGHSLGGGTAALGAMEFRSKNYTSWLDAEALGFGTPALVSPHLSEKYKDFITTVVNDADMVPRCSGLAATKTWLDIIAFNWTSAALEDFDHLISVISSDRNLQHEFFGRKGNDWLEDSSRNIRQWLEVWFDENVAPWLKDLPGKELNQSLEVELVPPGECIHLYRDGVAFRGSYVNCSMFDEFETVRHMIDDHLIPPGYYKAILSFVRDKMSNDTFVFEDSIPEIDYP